MRAVVVLLAADGSAVATFAVARSSPLSGRPYVADWVTVSRSPGSMAHGSAAVQADWASTVRSEASGRRGHAVCRTTPSARSGPALARVNSTVTGRVVYPGTGSTAVLTDTSADGGGGGSGGTGRTVNVAVPVPVLPAESVAVHTTSVLPTGKSDPEGGTHSTGSSPSTASTAVAVNSMTAPSSSAACAVRSSMVTTGAPRSLTVTVTVCR